MDQEDYIPLVPTFDVDIPAPVKRGRPPKGQEKHTRFGRMPRAPIARIREIHHTAARRLAKGERPVAIARDMGLTPQTIYNWEADDMFKDLVADFRANLEGIEYDHHANLAALAQTATQELHERLLEKPDNFSNGELLMLSAHGYDRTVAPKKVPAPPPSAADNTPRITIEFVQPSLSPNAQVVAGKIIDAEPA